MLFQGAAHICGLCYKIFRQQTSLRDHIRGAHGVGDPFMCDRCQRTFGSRRTWKRHLAKEACFVPKEKKMIAEEKSTFNST